MGRDKAPFLDPELLPEEFSEIEAAVDVSVYGLDGAFRPVFIGQDDQILALTLEDARRLRDFLHDAVEFVDEFQTRQVN